MCEKKSEPQLIESALSHKDYFYYLNKLFPTKNVIVSKQHI